MRDDLLTSKYNSIDFAKFLLAFFVVAIHTEPLITCKNYFVLSIYDSVVRLAVPFFFIVCGYFIGKKFDGRNDTMIIYKQIKKILKMYLFWTIIYSPLEICHFMSSSIPLAKEVLLYIRGFICVGEHYNSWPLWYLLSTLYGLVLIYFFKSNQISTRNIFLISFVIMLISFGIDSFVAIEGLNSIPYTIQKIIKISIVNGRILQGLFLIPFGLLLAKEELKISYAIALFIIGFLGNYLFDDYLGSLFLVICSVGFFKLTLGVSLSDRTVWMYLRKISMIIYLIHMYVWTFYYTIFYGEKRFGIDCFLFTSLFSLAIAIIYLYIQKRHMLSLNIFHSKV